MQAFYMQWRLKEGCGPMILRKEDGPERTLSVLQTMIRFF